jgi:hypothetical protein
MSRALLIRIADLFQRESVLYGRLSCKPIRSRIASRSPTSYVHRSCSTFLYVAQQEFCLARRSPSLISGSAELKFTRSLDSSMGGRPIAVYLDSQQQLADSSGLRDHGECLWDQTTGPRDSSGDSHYLTVTPQASCPIGTAHSTTTKYEPGRLMPCHACLGGAFAAMLLPHPPLAVHGPPPRPHLIYPDYSAFHLFTAPIQEVHEGDPQSHRSQNDVGEEVDTPVA